CRPASKSRRLARNLPLQPVRMILRQRVRRLIAVRRNALGPGNVDESVVALVMRRLRDIVDSLQFFFWVQKALVAPRDVIVHLNPEYAAGLRAARDLQRIPAFQSIGADADVVSPI